jgi:hypothetical protein
MTTSIKDATAAAIEANEAASNAWLAAHQAVTKAYTDYLLAKELGLSESEAADRYLALRKIERKASRTWDKARKLCAFFGVSE